MLDFKQSQEKIQKLHEKVKEKERELETVKEIKENIEEILKIPQKPTKTTRSRSPGSRDKGGESFSKEKKLDLNDFMVRQSRDLFVGRKKPTNNSP